VLRSTECEDNDGRVAISRALDKISGFNGDRGDLCATFKTKFVR